MSTCAMPDQGAQRRQRSCVPPKDVGSRPVLHGLHHEYYTDSTTRTSTVLAPNGGPGLGMGQAKHASPRR